ncbi:MAG: hypothetical protein U0T07_03775 [Chitinophagales bacterium]
MQVKAFNKNFNYEGHFFFILNKGMNSGKPMKSSCPNCFICIAASEEEKSSCTGSALLYGILKPFIIITKAL